EHLPIAIDLTRWVLKARQAMADSDKVDYAITQLLAKDYRGAEATLKEAIAQAQQEREFTLTFTGQGSNCWNDQDWTNAVDGDLDGWDGTVTTRGNDAGNNYRDPAWAVFALQNTATLNAVAIQTDNGSGDVYTPNRWATQIEILASMDGVHYTSVAKIQREKRVEGDLAYYRLADDIQANYLKLVIHAPYTANQAWRQLVEFKALYTTSARLAKTVDAFAVEPETAAPVSFTLEQNYPNPFNPSTTIGFILPEQETVQMVIYDLTGRTVNVLVNATMPAGRHQVIWNGADASGSPMPSGIYLCRLSGKTQIRTIKLMMVK
ncbi:T9SS type A sorting domain-containing protein, partial [bacterium]|nr:T9SS type A sorting domain-containing protein [bacterium]